MHKDADNYRPDVHAPPRPGYIVYPNKYKPLAGHTGKLTNVQPYLLFDPEVAYKAPPGSNGILTMKDYKRYLKQLNGKAEGPPQVFTAMKQMSSAKNLMNSHDDSSTDTGIRMSSSINQDDEFNLNLHHSPVSSRPSSARLPSLGEPVDLDDRPSTTSALDVEPSARLRREDSASSLSPKLKRAGSGTFQAHTGRAGPEYFLSQKAVQKSYREFIRTFSKDGIDGEEEKVSRSESFCSAKSESFSSAGGGDEKEGSRKRRPKQVVAKSNSIGSAEKLPERKRVPKSTSLGSNHDIDDVNAVAESKTGIKDASDSKSNSYGSMGDDDKFAKCEKSSSKDQPDESSSDVVEVLRDAPAECKSSTVLTEENKSSVKGEEVEAQFKQIVTNETQDSDRKSVKDEDADLSIYQDDDDFESCTSQKIADNDIDNDLPECGPLSPLSYGDNRFQENEDDAHTLQTVDTNHNVMESDDHHAPLSRTGSLEDKSNDEEKSKVEEKSNDEEKRNDEEKSTDEAKSNVEEKRNDEEKSNDEEKCEEKSNDEDIVAKDIAEEEEKSMEGELSATNDVDMPPQGLDTQSKLLPPSPEKALPDYQDDDFEKEQDSYAEDDFEPLSPSNSPEKLFNPNKNLNELGNNESKEKDDADVYDLSDDE